MSTSKTIAVRNIFHPLMGQKAWGVALGTGSFLTAEFGEKLPFSEQHRVTHGEWHLWLYHCAWRLERDDTMLACSEDSREDIVKAIQCLNGKKIENVSIQASSWDSVFYFEQQIRIRTFCIHSKLHEQWLLYTPERQVLTIGPGSRWHYTSENSP